MSTVTAPNNSFSEWKSLAVAADNGLLYLSPDVAEKCAGICRNYLAKLTDAQFNAEKLADVRGYGDFDSGRQLARIFSERAVGGSNNLVDVLQSHIDVVMEMQAVFKKFFTDTTNTDDTNATDITRNGPR